MIYGVKENPHRRHAKGILIPGIMQQVWGQLIQTHESPTAPEKTSEDKIDLIPNTNKCIETIFKRLVDMCS